MAGWGSSAYGTRASWGAPAQNKKANDPMAPSMSGYGQPLGGQPTPPTNQAPVPMVQGPGNSGLPNANLYQSADANYIRNIPTGYTPEQMLAMRNRATETAAAGSAGSNRRIRELMAAQGIGGSGAEAAAIIGNMRGNNAALQSSLSNLDIANANAGLEGGYRKAGLMQGLINSGLSENQLAQQGNQFNTSTYNDMYRWGNEQDYSRYRDQQSLDMYRKQLQDMLRGLNL